LNGNLATKTDRRGLVTSLSYDPLNRLKTINYNVVLNGGTSTHESATSFTYDAGSRLIRAVDSAGGTITDTYDNLDRLISESTPQGSVFYGYDNANRRASMTVAGQLPVFYFYDDANRLTQITQGTSNVAYMARPLGAPSDPSAA
jgi:YD repeat-containing protein